MENLSSKGGLSMAAFYQKFLRKHLDLSPLSVMRREDNDPYFCTPKGASIFGWAGVDGIHFCFVRGFGETVFAVSPMNGGKDCVHVIARDFSDFLRLLLATGDSAALEQAWQWDEAQFDAFLAENPPTDKQKAVLSQITTVFSLTPMERPWQYLRKLQAEFDLSKLKFTEDFYDPEMNGDAPEQKTDWKVYFDGSFWGHHGRERAGREMPVQKWFSWAGRDWFVPSVYVCSKGIVVDFCMRAEASALRGFMEKWGIDPESDESIDFSRGEREQMEREHPLSLGFTPSLTLNGAKLRTSHGCGVIFLPEQPGFCADAEPAMAHYGLDRAYGWSICRAAFPFVTKRAPKLKSLAVTMTADEVRVPGPRFRADKAGDTFAFSYRGTEYTLAVQEVEPQELPRERMNLDPRFDYPTHFTAISFTLTPEPPEHSIFAEDCAENDRPRQVRRETASFAPEAQNDFCFGIIGGADGPVAIVAGEAAQGKLHTACSSLHFAAVDHVDWRVGFRETPWEAGTFDLL
jgi:hypothetical protein